MKLDITGEPEWEELCKLCLTLPYYNFDPFPLSGRGALRIYSNEKVQPVEPREALRLRDPKAVATHRLLVLLLLKGYKIEGWIWDVDNKSRKD